MLSNSIVSLIAFATADTSKEVIEVSATCGPNTITPTEYVATTDAPVSYSARSIPTTRPVTRGVGETMFRSKGVKASLMVFVLIASGTMFAFSTSAASGPRQDNWTVALYVAADNNLEVAWDMYTLDALLAIPGSKRVNIVAMVDKLSTDTIELLEFTGGAYTVVETYPDMNTGDGETFSFFLDEIEARYPAQNMCIVPWNHGGSWIGFCGEDGPPSDIIRMTEFSAAVEKAALEIDVLAFDACLMSSVEVAYEASLTGLVHYMVASEMSIPFDGFPYDLMLTPLIENPAATPEELCDMMLVGWDAYYHYGRRVNLVVTDIPAFGAELPAFQAWSDALLAGLETYRDEYQTALDNSIGTGYAGTSVDVHDLCEQLVMLVDDESIVETSEAVMAAVVTSVVGLHTARYVQDMHGMSIWWNSPEYDYLMDRYTGLVSFVTDTSWGELQTAWVVLPVEEP